MNNDVIAEGVDGGGDMNSLLAYRYLPYTVSLRRADEEARRKDGDGFIHATAANQNAGIQTESRRAVLRQRRSSGQTTGRK
jgi:hypothetical protein